MACALGEPVQDERPPCAEPPLPLFDFDEASRAWHLNKYREANGMRYFRAVGDEVYVNTGMRWREAVVVGVNEKSIDCTVVGGVVLRSVADAKSHVQCVSSTEIVERRDGDGYDHRPTRRIERRELLGTTQKARGATACPPHHGYH
jgi:hypothetical protein